MIDLFIIKDKYKIGNEYKYKRLITLRFKMSNYFVGDIHGCYKQLRLLLKKVDFDFYKDTLWSTGDLVSRGPHSLDVLRFMMSLGGSVKIVLGNHDLYLIKEYFIKVKKRCLAPYMLELFQAKDIDDLICWLKKQPILRVDKEKKIILSHAGLPPLWNLDMVMKYSREIESVLSSNNINMIIKLLEFDDQKIIWNTQLKNIDKLKFSINGFTRMRYCDFNGNLNLDITEYPISPLMRLKPWFLMTKNIPEDFFVIFGHWASLKGKNTPSRFFALDTGCSWGKFLTALRWEDKKFFFQTYNCC